MPLGNTSNFVLPNLDKNCEGTDPRNGRRSFFHLNQLEIITKYSYRVETKNTKEILTKGHTKQPNNDTVPFGINKNKRNERCTSLFYQKDGEGLDKLKHSLFAM